MTQPGLQLLVSSALIFIIFVIVMGHVAWLILLERRVAAWMQDRHGPNRAGPFGLLQPIADGLKMFLKEDYAPRHVERPLFTIAPMLMMIPAVLALGVIPWGGPVELAGHAVSFTIAHVDIGLLYLLAVMGLGVYGIVLAGYASNNKYSFLGGMRSTAMMLSYEVPLALSILAIVLLAGQVTLEGIVLHQISHGWNIVGHPLLGIICFSCLLAEANRAPFDVAECEQELVGGFHTEYSSMRFGLFFLAEYTSLIVGMAFFSCLFLGGWDIPFLSYLFPALADSAAPWWMALVRFALLWTKVLLLIVFVMMIRWTLTRFRYDQIMQLSWLKIIPLATALLLINVGLKFGAALQPENALLALDGWVVSLTINILIAAWLVAAAGRSRTPITGRQSDLAPQPS